MSSKKLIIYEYDTLFNILNEIKENCNFEIIKADTKNFDNLKKDLNFDFLIISKNKRDSSTNYIDLNNTPIKINKLLELINIKFLKIKRLLMKKIIKVKVPYKNKNTNLSQKYFIFYG